MEWLVLVVPVVAVGIAFVIVSRGNSRSKRSGRQWSNGDAYAVQGTDAGHHHGHHHDVDGTSGWDQSDFNATPETGSDGGGFDSGGGDSGGGGDGGSD